MNLKGEDVSNKQKLRTIITDDNPAITLLLKKILQKQGHHVLTFPDPTACPCPVLKKENCFCPQEFACADIVISDIVMLNMSGIDFIKRQREGGCKTPDAHKAIISATADKEHIDAIEELGCNFFKKPFVLVEIVKWIEECAKRIPEDRILPKLG
jgi:CheY-like chemotaxis protein